MATMSMTDAEIQQVLGAWPIDNTGLPATVQALFDAWSGLRMVDINAAVRTLHDEPNSGFTRPSAVGFTKLRKCRTLNAYGVSCGAIPAPSDSDIRSIVSSSAPVVGDGGSDAIAEKFRKPEEKLSEAQGKIATLVRQQAAIEDNNDVTADYEVHDDVLQAVPASFVSSNPLSTKERQALLRNHAGSYPEDKWPPKLVMKDSTKNSKEMQKAKKYTLPQFATEVSSFMLWNDRSTKMSGTVWSRVLDLQTDAQAELDSNPDGWFRADDLVHQLDEVRQCAEAAFRLSMDVSASMRLNVAKKVDVAMGIDHLRVDPVKKRADDFISDETYKLVEAEAKKKQNLAWAQQGHFPGSRAGDFSRRPPSKSAGGGGRSSSRGGNGNGGRSSNHSGRGRGRGRGRGKGDKGRGTPSSD